MWNDPAFTAPTVVSKDRNVQNGKDDKEYTTWMQQSLYTVSVQAVLLGHKTRQMQIKMQANLSPVFASHSCNRSSLFVPETVLYAKWTNHGYTLGSDKSCQHHRHLKHDETNILMLKHNIKTFFKCLINELFKQHWGLCGTFLAKNS